VAEAPDADPTRNNPIRAIYDRPIKVCSPLCFPVGIIVTLLAIKRQICPPSKFLFRKLKNLIRIPVLARLLILLNFKFKFN
jgi:hypothetical protein